MLAAAGCTQLRCLPWHFYLLTSSNLHTHNIFSFSVPLPQRLKTRADFAVCAQPTPAFLHFLLSVSVCKHFSDSTQ